MRRTDGKKEGKELPKIKIVEPKKMVILSWSDSQGKTGFKTMKVPMKWSAMGLFFHNPIDPIGGSCHFCNETFYPIHNRTIIKGSASNKPKTIVSFCSVKCKREYKELYGLIVRIYHESKDKSYNSKDKFNKSFNPYGDR